jgi:hydrogenase 3 maturation protease
MLPLTWQEPLRQWITRQNRVAIIGIGNPLRSDDAAGVLVARRLADSGLLRDLDSVLVVEAGHAPENATAGLRRFGPQLVLLIDAAEMGETPGTIGWIRMEDIDGMSASTHTLPLSMLAKYLVLELGCDVKVIGIQPQSTEIGGPVSREVLDAVNEIAHGFTAALS